MRMTKIEWRYLQRIALDHPYFDTHPLPLSEKEARDIVKANNRRTGREFVDAIYASLGMPRPEKRSLSWLSVIGDLFTVPPLRKLSLSLLMAILVIFFLTATAPGKAFADSVAQYITTLWEDGRLWMRRSNGPEETGEEKEDTAPYAVQPSSVDAFLQDTGKTPLILPISPQQVYYEVDDFVGELTLYAVYDTPKGRLITSQIWGAEELLLSTDTGYEQYDADGSIYYSYEGDNKLIITTYREDTCFTLIARGDYSLQQLVDMITER